MIKKEIFCMKVNLCMGNEMGGVGPSSMKDNSKRMIMRVGVDFLPRRFSMKGIFSPADIMVSGLTSWPRRNLST